MMEETGKANKNNAIFQFCLPDKQAGIQDSHPIVLDKIEIAWQRLDYIHNNPVVAGFADKAGEYIYSSARDYYYDIEGKVPIKRLSVICIMKQEWAQEACAKSQRLIPAPDEVVVD